MPIQRIDMTPAQEAIAPVEPCTLVIFGGSGDLARRRLIPALYNLMLDGLLPANFAVLGLGRKQMSDEEFRATLREGVLAHSRQSLKEDRWSSFANRLFYLSGGNEDRRTYTTLKARVEDMERDLGLPGNRIFYLSIPPSSFAAVCEGLEHAGLAVRTTRPYARIIVEKPVGRDLASAQQINGVTGRVFDESQIFRIDHYLGKETVQNLMVVRFANSIFEPIWNHKYIDHVQITVSEAEGVGTRAAYYEEAGALRDMVQNHMLQLLCLVAMEPPYSLDPDVVRNAKMEVLRCLRPITGKDVETYTVRAQYAGGNIGDTPVPGYRREQGVKPDSTTETYVAVKCAREKPCRIVPVKWPCNSRTSRRFCSTTIPSTLSPRMSWLCASSLKKGCPYASCPVSRARENKPTRSRWRSNTPRYLAGRHRKPTNGCCWM